jgi:hypothetical protein
VIAAAGDIAESGGGQLATSDLIIDRGADAVLTAGDNAYPDGALSEFQAYYDPSWGRFKAKTRPSPGNHDYHISNAQGYRDYFGFTTGPLYYSYDLGAWHLIALDSEISLGEGSPQNDWLESDLAAHPNRCVMAYWHQPRFSSGSSHGNDSGMAPFWIDLYAAKADVVINGHDHDFERFGRQDPSGQAAVDGIWEFVAGTGGANLRTFDTPVANSEFRYSDDHGVLFVTLYPTGYDWRFLNTAGTTVDSGSGTCV